jgi:hypothetical protein
MQHSSTHDRLDDTSVVGIHGYCKLQSAGTLLLLLILPPAGSKAHPQKQRNYLPAQPFFAPHALIDVDRAIAALECTATAGLKCTASAVVK